jgi:type I restriction-modification system DNA methylase subunit
MRSHHNRGLFSNYYLDEILPKEDEFKIPIPEVKAVFENLKAIWDRSRFEAINEDQLRKHFLDKVLDYLGWVFDVNAPVPAGEWSKRPDYAFFLNNESLKTAQKGKKADYFKKVMCVAEAKRLGRSLDNKLKTEADPFEVQNPSLQISRYLWLTGVKWGILTDGKYWRLYERETSKRLDIFYEIDLEDLIESGSPEDFRYFYLLFRKNAFPEFIEKVYKGSVDYAEEVGGQLKENIYQALKTLAQGFLKTSGNILSEEHVKEVHDNALILLYRLLFILYAEHRDLLPLGVNKLYTESYSLDAFKKEIAKRADKNEPIASSTFGYWNKLKELFEIINVGNRELGVPPYNGGLFDSEKHHFLEKYRVGDFYVGKAVDLLCRSRDKAYIDYGSLEIRHLGSIYEGLLEYKLKIADKDLIPIKDKGKEVFVSLDEAKKLKKTIREDEKISAGEIYLITDKGGRKATGSYYTPDYIVKYIVENALSPLIEDRRNKISEKIRELKRKIKGTRGTTREFHEKELSKVEGSLIDEIFSLKVLDPAMGSGHFLVEATDFLARELLRILSGEPFVEESKEMVIRESSVPYAVREPEDEDIRWARREVVERCIFGVDLNQMAVELAKLSLWLYTVAKNRPLNFLDHHLRCGNSLIGANIDDLANLPEMKKKKTEIPSVQLGLFESIFKEKITILLGAFAQIEKLPSDTVEDIRRKESLYQEFRKIISRFQDVADVWTSTYFLDNDDFGNYQWQRLQNNLRSTDEDWRKLAQESWFQSAKGIANEKRFFHWELEFPEIFFEGHQRKEDPGFDAVIGNPPYGGELVATEKQYLKLRFRYTSAGKPETYIFFLEKSIELSGVGGSISLIIPNAWLTNFYAKSLREAILKQHSLYRIVDFTKYPVFADAIVDTSIPFIKCHEGESRLTHIDQIVKNNFITTQTVNQENWLADTDKVIRLTSTSDKDKLYRKIMLMASPLGELCESCQGIIPYKTKEEGIHNEYISSETLPGWKPLLDAGECVDRYSLEWRGAYISYGNWLWCPREPKFFERPKILFHRLRKQLPVQLVGTLDEKSFYNRHSLSNIIMKEGVQINIGYVLALFNSSLLNSWFVNKYGLLMEVGIFKVNQIPIRRINFVTPVKVRSKLLEEGRTLYQTCLEKNVFQNIIIFMGKCLSHKAQEADAIHDILAFLANQMIDMNKEKQKEAEGFLKWLESQLKIKSDAEGNTGIDLLTGKSQIKNYVGDYQKGEEHFSFKDFWKILERNKTKIQANLKSRQLYENIGSEYEKSLTKLLPLKEKLRKTDWLIDQIVYKLYGLSEEEIKIVEGRKTIMA